MEDNDVLVVKQRLAHNHVLVPHLLPFILNKTLMYIFYYVDISIIIFHEIMLFQSIVSCNSGLHGSGRTVQSPVESAREHDMLK